MGVTRTFVFWDLVGSTRAWEAEPQTTGALVAGWEAAADRAVSGRGGRIFKLLGDGGIAVFESAAAAVHAAIDLLNGKPEGTFTARVACSSGEAEPHGDDWLGVPLNRGARLMGLGHGGQLLVSGATAQLLPPGVFRLVDLGEHRLRDVEEPARVYQVSVDGGESAFPHCGASDVNPVSRTLATVSSAEKTTSRFSRSRSTSTAWSRSLALGGRARPALPSNWPATRAPVSASSPSSTSRWPRPTTMCPASWSTRWRSRRSGTTPTAEFIAAYVADRPALLVLDNAEHVVDGTAALVEHLLDQCEGTQLVVTSREPLGVQDEHVVRVRSLDWKAAVELLESRLGHPVSDTSRAEELCRHLDGIPLAIELAAGRVRTLGLDDVVANLGNRLALLVGGRRATGRQATLQATLAWSYGLLSFAEQTMLRRLSVFVGGFTADSAVRVCGSFDEPPRNLLAALVDKSLVDFDATTRRHRMLETIRLFAQERLVDAGEVATIRDAHARWAFDDLFGAIEIPTMSTTGHLVDEAPNIRAAIDWLITTGRDVDALRLLTAYSGLGLMLQQEAELAPVMIAAYDRCEALLDTDAAARACACIQMHLGPRASSPSWLERTVTLDPAATSLGARTARVMLAFHRCIPDPEGALHDLAYLRSLPGAVDPDADLLMTVIEFIVRFRAGDLDGADRTLSRALAPGASHFRPGPVAGLALFRALRGDGDGARAAYENATADPHAGLRHLPVVFLAVDVAIALAEGNMETAAAELLAIEEQLDGHLKMSGPAWSFFYDAAAGVAHAQGDLRSASILSLASAATFVVETLPFVAWTLEARYGDDPTWRQARTPTLTFDDAKSLARQVAHGSVPS